MEINATITNVGELQEGTSSRSGQKWQCKEFIVAFDEGITNQQGGSVTSNVTLKTFKKDEIDALEVGRKCKIVLSHSIHSFNRRMYNEVNLESIEFEAKPF